VSLRWCLLRYNLKWSVKEKFIDVFSDIKISYLDDFSAYRKKLLAAAPGSWSESGSAEPDQFWDPISLGLYRTLLSQSLGIDDMALEDDTPFCCNGIHCKTMSNLFINPIGESIWEQDRVNPAFPLPDPKKVYTCAGTGTVSTSFCHLSCWHVLEHAFCVGIHDRSRNIF
jgi:hypothetical protein